MDKIITKSSIKRLITYDVPIFQFCLYEIWCQVVDLFTSKSWFKAFWRSVARPVAPMTGNHRNGWNGVLQAMTKWDLTTLKSVVRLQPVYWRYYGDTVLDQIDNLDDMIDLQYSDLYDEDDHEIFSVCCLPNTQYELPLLGCHNELCHNLTLPMWFFRPFGWG